MLIERLTDSQQQWMEQNVGGVDWVVARIWLSSEKHKEIAYPGFATVATQA